LFCALSTLTVWTVLLSGAPVWAAGVSFSAQRIISAAANGANSVFVADVDGDTDLDVLSASFWDSKIAWYENVDGLGSFGPEQVITTMASDARAVFAADLDGDGDVDVLSASSFDNTIAWYENTDGLGTFGPRHTIENQASEARAVIAADLDGDSDMDVLSASLADDTIAWYENTDGAGSFGPQLVISTAADGPITIFAADLDGDTDLDVLSASSNDNEIAWYENTDGLGTFGPQQIIFAGALGAWSVFAADVDGDGDVDVLSASFFDDTVAWYENMDGTGTFGPQLPISTVVEAAISVFAVDMDRDGDFDVITGSLGDEISWHANLDGAGSFGAPQLVSAAGDGPSSVFAADLDGDGDPDVAVASNFDDEISWYENLLEVSVPAVSTAGLVALAALLVGAALGILRNLAVGARSCADPPESGC
jgi:hypothetical protein